MQKSLITSLILLGATPVFAGPAFAGSFEPKNESVNDSGSIITIGCPKCAADKSKEDRAAKMLPPGTELHEIREVDGQMMLYTTENWLGGTPVVIVRKAHVMDVAKYSPENVVAPNTAIAETDTPDAGSDIEAAAPVLAGAAGEIIDPGVDVDAKTAALPEAPKEFDASKLELRID